MNDASPSDPPHKSLGTEPSKTKQPNKSGEETDAKIPPLVASPSHKNSSSSGCQKAYKKAQDYLENIKWFFSEPSRALALLTAGLVVIGIIALCIQRDTEQRQLRAYVSVLTAEIQNLSEGEMVTAVIKIKNFGQTPAYKFRHWQRIIIDKYPFPGRIPYEPDDGIHPSSPLSPGDDSNGIAIFDVSPMNQTTINALKAGTNALYVVGTIKYDDIFGTNHTTIFCLYAGGKTKMWDGSLAVYSEGNEAD